MPSWKFSCCHITNSSIQRSALASFSALKSQFEFSRQWWFENGRLKCAQYWMGALWNWQYSTKFTKLIRTKLMKTLLIWFTQEFFFYRIEFTQLLGLANKLIYVKFTDDTLYAEYLSAYLTARVVWFFERVCAIQPLFTFFFQWHWMKFVARHSNYLAYQR